MSEMPISRKTSKMRTDDQKGMTLVEILVSLVVLLIVIGGAGAAYLKLLKGFKTQSKVSESYTENLAARELLRYDIEMAGYGLPYDLTNLSSPKYNEAVSNGAVPPDPPDPASFNDAPNNIPRSFVFSDNQGQNSSDVLVIKSQAAGINKTSRKWSVLYYDSATSRWKIKKWNNTEQDFSNPDRFIILDTSRALQKTSTNWYFTFLAAYYSDASALAIPGTTANLNLVYGVDPDTNLRMPFNRVDYYLKKPASNFPSRCYENSCILYRSTINQGDGARNDEPLMDCVMDFQVAFGLDTDGDRNMETWITDLNTIADTNGNGTADEIRSQVRQVSVSILFHEGRKDDTFQFSGSLNLSDVAALGSFTPTGDAVHYRWKVLQLAIKPMNLME